MFKFRVHFNNLTIPSHMDVHASTQDEAFNQARDHLAQLFAAEALPVSLATYFIFAIDNLSEEEINALCPTSNSPTTS